MGANFQHALELWKYGGASDDLRLVSKGIYCASADSLGSLKKSRAAIGVFCLLRFFVVLVLARWIIFLLICEKHRKQKKGLERHYFSGLDRFLVKNTHLRARHFERFFKFSRSGGLWICCVIGNKYGKTCLKHAASLVTGTLKHRGNACRHW